MPPRPKSFGITVTAGSHQVKEGTVVNGEPCTQLTVLTKGDNFESDQNLAELYPEKFVLTNRVRQYNSSSSDSQGSSKEDNPDRPPYEDMTKDALLVVAADCDAAINNNMNKADLIAAIDKANGT